MGYLLIGYSSLDSSRNKFTRRRQDLEADPAVFDAGIRNADAPDRLVTETDIADIDTESFQTGFKLFDSKVIVRQHNGFPLS